jgi:hypothetical protein
VAIAANGDSKVHVALILKMAKGFSYEERSGQNTRLRGIPEVGIR